VNYADKVNAYTQNSTMEILMDVPSTAHILGGVPMGKTYSDIATGVYFYMIHVYNGNRIPVFSDSGKMILLK